MRKFYAPFIAKFKKSAIAFLAVLFCLMISERGYSQILAWDYNGLDGSQTTVNSTTTNANLNISTISRGSGLGIPAAGGNRFAGTFDAIGYSTGTTSLATAIIAQEYFQFTISAKSGYGFSLSTLDANFLRSSINAPSNFQWQYSLNGFASAGINIGSAVNYTGNYNAGQTYGTAQAQINLSGISALQNLFGTTVTIRIYGWSAGNTGSTFGLGLLTGNDLTIGGTVTASTPTITSFTPTSACSGTTPTITLTGTNFTGATAVKFGTTTAAFTINSATQITATMPMSLVAGNYTIYVTTGGGTANSSSLTPASFTVNALPTATISYPGTPFCSTSGTATVTQTGTSGGTYSSTAGLSLTPSTGDINLSASTPGSYTVTYSFTNGTCSNTTTAPITITAAPIATISYSSPSFCTSGGTASVTRTGTTGGTYTASPAGLSINSSTGAITLGTSTPNIYTITYSIAASGGCIAYSAPTASVTVNASPTATISYGGLPYCSNSGTATVTQTGTAAGTYTSTAGLSLNVSTGDVNLSASTAGTYTVTYTFTNGTCSNTTTASIVINAAPSISGQPSNQITCAGTAKTFSVTAAGTSPTYQWQYSPDGSTWNNVANGTPANVTYTNGTTATLTVTPSGSAANGTYYYQAVVSVIGCTAPLTSSSATLVVSATPTTSLAGPTQTLCTTTTNTTLAANNPVSGTGAWTVTSGPSTSTTQFSDVTNPTATFTPAGGAGTYALKWTISNGTCTASSSSVNIVVNTAPSISSQPTNKTDCAGGTGVTFSVTAAGTSPAYQWQYSADGSTWNNVANGAPTNVTYANSTTSTLTVTPSASAANGTYYYRAVVSVIGCSAPLNSSSATLVVSATPTASNAGSTQNLCTTTTNTTLAANTPANGTGAWTVASGPNTSTTQFSDVSNPAATFTPAGGAGTYKLNWTISNGPCTASSSSVNIVVNTAPSATISYSGSPFCKNLSTGTVTRTGTSGGSYSASPGGLSINSGSGTITPSSSTAGTYTVTYTIAASGGCGVFTTTTSVIINPLPTAGAISGGSNVCIGSTITLLANPGGTGPFTYSWSSSSSTVATVDNAGNVLGKASGTTQIKYTVTDANGCTSATSSGFNVTVTQPTANAITQVSGLILLCANGTLQLTSNGSGVGTPTYAWTSSDNTKATVDNTGLVSGVAAGTTNIFYTVTDGNGCTATSAAYPLTVVAPPNGIFAATEFSGIAPNDNIICAGSNVTFAAPPTYNAYTFYVNGVKVLGPSAVNLYNTNSLFNGDKVTVNVANAANCGTTFGPITITVNPLPTPTLISDKTTACFGDNVTFTAGGGTNYTFKVGVTPVQSGASNTYITNTLAVGNSSVTVDVSDGNSCAATSAAVSVTINPVSTGVLTPNPATMCVGETKTFTATVGFNNYVFNVGATSVQGPGASNTFDYTPSVSGGFVISVTAKNSFACATTFNAAAVNVNALPTGTLAVTENSGTANDNIICAGAPVTFKLTPSGYTDYKFYLNGTGTALQGGGSNSYTSTTLADGDYITVVVTNGNSCSATFTSPTIKVNPIPAGTLSVSPSNIICANDAVTFTATFISGDTYKFKIGATTAQTGSSNIFQPTPGSLHDGDVVSVDVTNSNTCITTFNSYTMVVNAPPTGTLAIAETSGNTDNDGIICAGAPVKFTAPTGTGYSYNFLIKGATAPGQDGTNVYTTSSLLDQDIVTVTVKNASGCVTLLNSYTITVNPLPVVPAIIGNMSVCVNSTTTLSDATSGGTWTSSDATKATVDPLTGVVTGVAAGAVNIIYTVTNSNGCSQMATASFTVNALPVVAVIGGPNGVCVNSDIALTEETPGGTWSTGDASIATVDGSGNVTGVASGTVSISYTVTNGNGCTTIVNKTINVYALSIVPAITGTFSVCVNATTALANTTGGGVWGSGNTAIATVNASTGVVTGIAPGTATISYMVTDGNGCSTTVIQNVVVNALPVPTLSGPNPICLGSTGNLYSTENTTGIKDYVWNIVNGSVTAGGTGADNTVTISWLTAGAKSISVNYTDINGCVGAASATVANAPGSSPTVSGDQTVCQGTTNVTYTAPSGKIDYSWTISSGGSPTAGGTSADPTVTVTWTGSGAQSVTINYAEPGGCSAATPTAWPVTVNPLPTVFNISGGGSYCSGGTGVAIGLSGSQSGVNYQLYNGASAVGSVVGGTGSAISFGNQTAAGTYTVVATNATTGCTDNMNGSEPITINPLPTVFDVTGGGPYCDGGAGVPIGLSGSQLGVNYQLYNGANPIGSVVGGTGSAISFGNQTSAGTYKVVAADASTGCTINMNGSEDVTVNPLPAVFDVTGGGGYCTGGKGVDIGLSGSQSGVNYQLYNGASPVGSAVGGTGSAISFGNQTPGTYTVVAADATTGCTKNMNGSETVVVNPLPGIFDVTGGGPYCIGGAGVLVGLSGSQSGVNYQLYNGATPIGTSVSGTGSAVSFGSQTIGGIYTVLAAYAITGCTSNMNGNVTVTVNPLPTIFSVTGGGGYCAGGSGSVIGLSSSELGINYQLYNGAVAVGSAVSGTASAISFGNQTAIGTYTVVAINAATGCTSNMTGNAIVTINPLPTITGKLTVCEGTSTQLTGSGIPAASNPWISGTTSVATVNTSGLVSGVVAGTSLITYTDNFGCNATASVTVSAATPITTVNASPSSICLGGTSNLSIPSGGSATLLSENFEGTNSFTVTNLGTTTSGTEWSSTNSGYQFDYDCYYNRRGKYICPSNVTFNSGSSHFMLANSHDPNRSSYTYATNTALVSPSISTVGYTSLNLSYSTYYKHDNSDIAVVEVSTDNGVNWTTVQNLNNSGTATNFANQNVNLNAYINIPNLKIRFRYKTNSNWWWAIDDISVKGNAPTGVYSWTALPSASAGLPAGAGTPSSSNASIVVNPTAAGSIVYTALLTNAAGCISTKDVTLTVNTTPVVSIGAQYCAIPGRVLLTATSVPTATSYIWNNRTTKDTTSVDIAGLYDVTVLSGAGCPGFASINVAQELVTNGDFEAGNDGSFTSDFAFKMDQPGLVPAGQGELYNDNGNNAYSITPSGQNVHINFWGYDHTSGNGTGKFMAVNGHLTNTTNNLDTLVVWKETVNVLPNTTYYFSAWAMSLNNAGPFAQLQFSVNGTLSGTTAVLANHCENCSGGGNNDNWTRFYGAWTSGPTTTTADIYINDLQNAQSGNDFGLDDVSFGTLSTFIYLVSPVGTDAQVVCANDPLATILYNVGNGNTTGPAVIGLPDGVTSTFAGDKIIINGTPTVPGNYTYTITTSGCNPQTSTGTITVQSQTITLSSGSANPVQCKTDVVDIGFTLGGTATDATVTGLPGGVIGTKSGNTYTISGTPNDTAGVYHYSIITLGSSCNPDTVKGTITLQEQTITHNLGDSIQTVCINSPIKNIQYKVGGPGTLNGAVTGLPDGVSSLPPIGGIMVISGTPTESGTFKYYVTGSGTCADAKDSGVITVTPAASLTLTTGNATQPSVCINSPIADITYSLNYATTATVDGLPHNVTGSVSGNEFTITGTPDTSGVFMYTVTTTDGCGTATATGTITVNAQKIDLTTGAASPSVCEGVTMAPIIYTIGGTANAASATNLPDGVQGDYDPVHGTFTISGVPGTSGPFGYTVTVTGTCATDVFATGTITVQQAPVGGDVQAISTAVCQDSGTILTLMHSVGTIKGWQSSIDGGLNWTPLNGNGNVSISQTVTSALVPTVWRALITNGCGTVPSATATVSIHNLWTGASGTSEWNTGGNWSDGFVPSNSCPVVKVPVVTIGKYPVLSGGSLATINSLDIDAGASVTVTGSTIQIGGGITNNGIFDVTNGTVELNGAAAQNIDGNNFANGILSSNNTVKNLIISNNVNVGNTTGDTLNITGTLSFGTSTAKLQTGDNLTLKSSATATANVGAVGTNNHITGDVTVERYSQAIQNWQFLAIPTQTNQTIHEAWQENQAKGIVGTLGYGTQITGPVADPSLDFVSSNPSMKYWDNGTQAYINITKTNIQFPNSISSAPNTRNGFFLFIRGDRQATAILTTPHDPTLMRTKGSLFTGDILFTVPGNAYYSLGNPYASEVSFDTITTAAGFPQFYVWDPLVYGDRGAGGYQTFSNVTEYKPTIPTDNYLDGVAYPYLESGQAAFVHNATGGNLTLTFKESNKVTGSHLVFRGGDISASGFFRTYLYNASARIVDGNAVVFNPKYQNKLDPNDAVKIRNSSENLGLKRNGIILAVEARNTVLASDTIYFDLKNVSKETYKFGFNPENMQDAAVTAYLVDSYLKTQKEVSLTGPTSVDFTVNSDAGSYAADRFMIVFKRAAPLPVTFVSVKAAQKDKDIVVNWNMANENNMLQYDVEKSLDGNNFVKVATVAANNTAAGNYQWIDGNATPGNNYYRIKSVDKNQKIVYSTTVNVLITNLKTGITIYPNPITDAVIHLQFINQPQGKYRIRLLDPLGQLILAKQVDYAGGNGSEEIKWNYKMARGIYELEITREDGSVVIIKVLY